MTAQRILAWLLIAVQAVALGFQSRTVLFPAAVGVAALAGAVSRFRVRLTSEQSVRAGALLALIFFAKYLIAPHSIPLERLFIRTQLALALGQYLLVMQVAQLFLLRQGGAEPRATAAPTARRPEGKTPPSDDRLTVLLPGLGVIAMICFAAVRLTEHERQIFQAIVVTFVVFAGLYFGASRKAVASSGRSGPRSSPLGRSLASGAALIATAALGWTAAETLFHHERSLEQLISEWLSPSGHRTGFTTDGTLGSVSRRRDTDANDLALTIVSQAAPGYLQGQVFDSFRRSYWQSTATRQGMGRTADAPAAIADRAGGSRIFALRPADAGEWTVFEVWPAAALEAHLFQPRGTTHLAVRADALFVDRNGNIEAQGLAPGDPYLAFQSREPPADSLDDLRREPLSALPEEWRDARHGETGALVRDLAARLFARCRTDRDKMEAVERHFRTAYRYDPQVRVPAGQDPLAWFLREKPAAYCEYFATAAALVLRQGGVPARYITGFVAMERHRFGDYWVARNKDAHAWVEAWDDERGWVIVEATPAEGVPAPAPPPALAQLWEYLRNGLHRFRTSVSRDGVAAVLPAVVGFLTSIPGLVCAAFVVAWLVFRFHRRRSHTGQRRVSVEHRGLHRLLARMDRQLQRRGWQRRADETLHAFARRLLGGAADNADLAAAAQWYLQYAGVRYGAQPEGVPATDALPAVPQLSRLRTRPQPRH